MAKPQQPELRRSGRVPALDPDATEAARSGEPEPFVTPETGPIPEDQRPGHHPDEEQDKPDLDAFAERFGTKPPSKRARKTSAGTASTPTTDDDSGRRPLWWLGFGALASAAVSFLTWLFRRLIPGR